MRIERTNPHRTVALFSSACLAAALFLMLMVFCGAAWAPAQAPVDEGPTRALESDLRTAVEQHAGPEQQGVLWHSLGLRYENGFDYDKAYDAYAHAIHLLRNTPRKAEYADSLRASANIFVMQGREKEARNNLVQARALFEELGDTHSAACVRSSFAMSLVREHKFQEAEAEASAALGLLESFKDPDRVYLESTYLTRARAIAGEGRPQTALEDVARAQAIVTNDHASIEIDRIAILLVQGEVQMQAGFVTEGAQSMTEALKRARALSGPPRRASATLEASILEREAASLRKAHHKDEAKVLEDQRRQALTAARAGCGGCTVSVNSLLPQ